jgi:hypothetical protein
MPALIAGCLSDIYIGDAGSRSAQALVPILALEST